MEKPDVRLDETGDEPVILIGNGFLAIRPTEVEAKSILGTKMVPGFVLEITKYYPATHWQPEEYDYAEVGTERNFGDIVLLALKPWVAHQAQCYLEADGYAKMLDEEKRLEQAAYEGGLHAFRDGKPLDANDQPQGTVFYDKWRQGWRDGETVGFTEESA